MRGPSFGLLPFSTKATLKMPILQTPIIGRRNYKGRKTGLVGLRQPARAFSSTSEKDDEKEKVKKTERRKTVAVVVSSLLS